MPGWIRGSAMPETTRRGLLADRRAAAGLALLGGLVLVAALAPLVAWSDPTAQGDVVATRFLPPLAPSGDGSFHLLGTDRFGRDVWARLAYGARVSLATGFLATAIAVLLGLLVGTVAGVWRGAAGRALMAVTDFALALPRVVLLLLLAALWPPSGVLVVVVLGLTGWMSIARLVYGEATGLMARPFVLAARSLGAPQRRIAFRHLLPNLWTPVVVAAALGVGNAITLEAGLSFLGLGVPPPVPSLGGMIFDARSAFATAPWTSIFPGLAIVLVVIAVNLVGDALRAALDRRSA